MRMFVVAVVWALAGCSGGGGDSCVPGKTEACACESGARGVQTCGSNGTFGICACGMCPPQTVVPCVCDAMAGQAMCGTDGKPGACDCTYDAGVSDAPGDAPADASDAGKPPKLPPLYTLDIPAKHLAWNPATGVIYATVSGKAEKYGNSILTIDGQTAAVLDSVPLGPEPGAMALSDDHAVLWVSVDGTLSLRWMDATAPALVPSPPIKLPLANDKVGTYARSMFVEPGSTTRVVASLHSAGHLVGVYVLDNGVALPKSTAELGGGSATITSGPPGWAFGFNDLTSGFGFYSIAIDAMGVTETETKGLVSGWLTELRYSPSDARVYATSGAVIDVSTPTAPSKAGAFSFAGPIFISAPGEVWMVSPASSRTGDVVTVRRLSTTTFAQERSRKYDEIPEGPLWDAVPAGGSHVAFLSRGTDELGPSQIHFAELP